MDYTISNNARLFDEIIAVLRKHYDEPGAGNALEDLELAKANYVQRSIDHLVNSLILVIHDLLINPPSQSLHHELREVVHRHYQQIFQAGSKLSALARQYESGGGRLLSRDEILEEVNERRGASR